MSRYSPYSISVREQQSDEDWRLARLIRRAQRIVETVRSKPFDLNLAVGSSSSDTDSDDYGGGGGKAEGSKGKAKNTKGKAKDTMGKGMGKGLDKAKGCKGKGKDTMGKGLGEGEGVASQWQPGKGVGKGGKGEGDGKGMWMCQISHGLEWWRWVPDEERMR